MSATISQTLRDYQLEIHHWKEEWVNEPISERRMNEWTYKKEYQHKIKNGGIHE